MFGCNSAVLNFFCFSLPFLLAYAMATPMSRLSQILGRPKHRHHAVNSSGFAEIFRPFVGFGLFFVGKLSFALPLFVFGFTSKPFYLYFMCSIYFLSPFGLHFFMAYQEFAFFSCCTFYRTSVNRVLETANVEEKTSRTSHAPENAKEETSSIAVIGSTAGMFYDDLEELVEIMKNMIETYGPFLLQNLAMMLLFWLLHVYCLVFTVYQFATEAFRFDAGLTQWAFIIIQIAGLVLIVWWVCIVLTPTGPQRCYHMHDPIAMCHKGLKVFFQLRALEGGYTFFCMWTLHRGF